MTGRVFSHPADYAAAGYSFARAAFFSTPARLCNDSFGHCIDRPLHHPQLFGARGTCVGSQTLYALQLESLLDKAQCNHRMSDAKCFRRRSRLAAYFVVIARADLCPCSCQQAKMKDFEFPIGELPFFASLLASPPITKVVSAGFHFRYCTILFFGNSTPPDCARSSLTILVRPVTPILDIRRNCMDEYKVT
jgi:hypothetical protein